MRIVTYNVRFGGRGRVEALAAVLAALEPDVIALEEATHAETVRRLGAQLGMPHIASLPGYSVAALSRVPFAVRIWHHAPRIRAFLEFAPVNSDLRFVAVHFPSGLHRRGERARLRHVDALLDAVGPHADDRTVVVGDLNAVAPGDEPLIAGMPLWLRLLLRFDGGTRTDVLHRLAGAGWVDAYRSLHHEPGFTLPSGAPRIRLDYVLTPAGVLPRVERCEPVTDLPDVARASDHLPLLTVLSD